MPNTTRAAKLGDGAASESLGSRQPAAEPPLEGVNARELQVWWRAAPERDRFVRVFGLTAPVVAIATGFGVGRLVQEVLQAGYYEEVPGLEVTLWALLAGLLVGSYGAAVTYFVTRRHFWRAFIDRLALEHARSELSSAEQSLVEESGAPSFSALWDLTQKRLDYYHQIATSQAQRSFRYGQLAAGAGLVVIVASAIFAITADSTAGTVSASVLGVAGAGLAGYVGATFMRAQDSAAAQLRAYFSQPLEFSKYLAAERLLSQIDDGELRAKTVAAVVEHIVRLPPASQ